MLVQLPMKLKKPEHITEVLKSDLREYWIYCIQNCYEKMHNSTTLSCPLLKKTVPNKKKVLSVRLSFDVKITDVIDFYELRYRICANGSRIIEGQDYGIPYALTTNEESLRFMVVISSEENKELLFIDISNAFQTNIIFNPEDR